MHKELSPVNHIKDRFSQQADQQKRFPIAAIGHIVIWIRKTQFSWRSIVAFWNRKRSSKISQKRQQSMDFIEKVSNRRLLNGDDCRF
jgi:hypothetical protein